MNFLLDRLLGNAKKEYVAKLQYDALHIFISNYIYYNLI